ncbi:P-loop containing nucleoside triphosphate hydrolase superfamily protein [Zea mays]|uniref:p-loop containing nucleoside triphosphate hydrolase superfamily protein n=1 Tax=Zea mays TaxID=4577 RepID=A0A1D6I1M0_MAIZE|nr:P-loop containing nucleoside triphosphate hydrolase superfamily protein [Zea mays]
MSPHHRHFTSQFSSSYYAPVRPQRRRELKLLPLPDYSPTSCYHSGHLRLVSPAVPYERALSALVGRHSYPTSSHGGRDDNAIVETKESRRRPRKGKKTAPNQGVRAPSSSELSTRTAQSGDPLGRKELGQHVVHWLKQGMRQMASEFASSDQPETQGNKAFLWSDGGHAAHAGFVAQAQAHLSATPMPKGQDALCRTASAHYPTLFDNFQRELRDVLLRRLEKTRLMQARIDGFVQQMTGLLRLERDAELELAQDHEVSAAGTVMDGMPKKPVVAHGQAQEDGDTICNLRVISSSTGLTGQHLVLFRAEGSHRLPATRLSPGDTKRGLQKRNASIGVVATLFGDKEDATKPERNSLTDRRGPEAPDGGSLETHSHSFDTSQSRALALALDKERPVLVIQGPPGTGKTRLLSYLVARVVRRGERVLVTAPSNAAVDNMAESLSASGLKNIVRVGNPSRISPSVAPMSLGQIVATRLEKLTREFETRRSALRKDLKRRVQDGGDGSSVRQQLKRLGKDYRKEKKEAVREVLANAEVVLSTNTGAADPLVRGTGGCFDLVIIDEAGQAIEPSCWIPMLQGKRCILAGDHRQLAPVVLSREAMEGGLGMSLLERASSLHDGLLATTLTTQYRMHESIASWASKEIVITNKYVYHPYDLKKSPYLFHVNI